MNLSTTLRLTCRGFIRRWVFIWQRDRREDGSERQERWQTGPVYQPISDQSKDLPVDVACIPTSANTKEFVQTDESLTLPVNQTEMILNLTVGVEVSFHQQDEQREHKKNVPATQTQTSDTVQPTHWRILLHLGQFLLLHILVFNQSELYLYRTFHSNNMWQCQILRPHLLLHSTHFFIHLTNTHIKT